MTCRKAKKLMPLYAGNDLRPRLMTVVRTHVDSCPGCRKELAEYRESLSRLKAAAKAESVPDWSEAEWRTLAARFRPAAAATRRPAFLGRPRWAAASLLGAVIGVAVLSVLFRDTAPRPKAGAVVPALAEGGREQNVISMTMVSPESGLQVVWFFNKDFEWKGDEN